LEKIVINTSGRRSEIFVGRGWRTVSELVPAGNTVIITDDNIMELYGSQFPGVPVFSVKPGEESKKLSVLENLAEKLLDSGIDRNGFILAIGGGVVCDLAGFLASVYLRGIGCGYVASSLLAQVDASTGGKNGVNLGGTKNILGVIRQPEFVICDPEMLLTLSGEEYLSGLAEMIKTAIIGDTGLFEMIEVNHGKIMERDLDLLTRLVARSVRFKAGVVNKDEMEKGLRRILNFGHTFGHAIEMETMSRHGFAVASGMELATEFSFERGLIDMEIRKRIIGLLEKFGLLQPYEIPFTRIEKLVMHDKKKAGSELHFVFSQGIGCAVVEKVSIAEITDFYSRYISKK
jgi:3-dehydroquinate synthase